MSSAKFVWGLLALNLSCSVLAETQLETVQVVGKRDASAYMESVDDIAERLREVPGGTNVVDMENTTKLSSLSDALNYQPGIIVQEFFGGLDQPRINVRGSGIQGNPVSRGILLRQDYLPLNEADGSFIIGVVNLRNTAAITVHRGANSRTPGSFTLGGDMNFISSMEDNQFNFESGSFGQQAIQVSYGAGEDSLRWHGSMVEEKAEGYRHHSASQRSQVSLAFTTQFSDNLSNYTHLHFTDMAFEMPFVLLEATAEANPRWVFGDGVPIGFEIPMENLNFIDLTQAANTLMDMYKRDPHRATEQFRLSNRTTVVAADTMNSIGWYIQTTDDAFVDPFTHTETKTETLGLQWLSEANPTDYLRIKLDMDFNQSDMPRTLTGNHPFQGSKIGNPYAEFDLQAKNTALSAAFDLIVTSEITLIGQWQQGHSSRKGKDTLQANESNIDLEWRFNLPKFGIIYQPTFGNSRWFFNISESIELPTFWELVAMDLNPLLTWMSQARLQKIDPQHAISVELGGDYFINDDWRIQATAYHSEIEKELISTASQFGVLAETHNYDNKTIHQGVELGINGTQVLTASSVMIRGSWTYSDFYFKDGIYAGNQIAGVPQNVVMVEGLWQKDNWRLGPNLRWVPDNNPVDHANTLNQKAYALLGFTAEILLENYLRLYFAADNLTDETYNSSYVVRAQSNALLPTFLPGNGRSVSLGMNFDF